jgi:hypothetical protein
MPALNKTRTPTPNSTIKLTVCGPALSRTWVVLTSEILVRYLGRVRLGLAQRRAHEGAYPNRFFILFL